jgi:hypothetical protein
VFLVGNSAFEPGSFLDNPADLKGSIMSLCGSRRIFVTLTAFTVVALSLSSTTMAQQVSYYDFDTPFASSQFSYACVNPVGTAASVTNPLFCLNDGTGQASDPSFLSDLYPAIVDPVTTDNPPVASTHVATQMTPSAPQQTSSLWFSVPQKVSNGFTAYFAFRITPTPNSFATADGLAFVIQNSAGGGTATASDGTSCTTTGAGPTIVGVAGPGGCLGFGGIDNSLALEFDTYQNGWDPNNNHIALQNCGAGLPNSPDHTGSCLVNLNVSGDLQAAITSQFGVTLADGNVHQVIVEYSGPTEATPNQLQVFIDPPFVEGTHTPVPGTVPSIIGVYDIAANLNLMNSGTVNDSAYVGFTSATGAAFEQHELLAWTFTPHTPSTQQQPLSPPGQPTTFPFGSHTFTVTYPVGSTTTGIDMIVTANTITPAFFTQLSVGRPYAGAQCQVYDETGGNCVVYSASCVTHGTTTVVACPQATDPNNLINLKSAYNNTVQPVTPGFLQGDPLYTQITSITGDGTTATVTCAGECSVTTGQTVTIGGTVVSGPPPSSFDGTVTVAAADPNAPGSFTFSSTVIGTATSGYLASNNVQNIFTSYVPQRIDGTTAGKTRNFSDFIVTSATPPVTTSLVIKALSISYGSGAQVTVTATSLGGTPTGDVSLSVDNGTPQTQTLANGIATFTLTGLAGGTHQLAVTYAAQGTFPAATATSTLTISPIAPTVTFTGAPATASFGSTFTVATTTNSSAVATIIASGSCTIAGTTVRMTSGIGVCSLTANWTADGSYLAATASQSTTASKAVSATTITADMPNPSSVGSSVALGFTVSGVSTPTGTFTIASSISGDPSCSGPLVAGAGSCALAFLTAGPRTLTVTYSGDSNFAGSVAIVVQNVNPASTIAISPSTLDFGTVYLGSVTLKTVTVTNTGGTTLTISEKILQIVGGGNSNEFVALTLCPSKLAAGKSCGIVIGFLAGPTYTPQTATLLITDSAVGSPQSVVLTANVINPVGSFRTSEVDFGNQKVGSISHASTTFTNTGSTPLKITNINISGSNASDFAQSNACPATLAPGSGCAINVQFTPSRTGSRTAKLTVADNARGGSQQIQLEGQGK